MTKKVWLVEDPRAAPTLLATFRLDATGPVCAEFSSPGFESEVLDGILTPTAWEKPRVFIEDGRLFFDALDTAFIGSSLTFVTRET